MGFGGVAIAALYFVLRFGLAFSDGLGGYTLGIYIIHTVLNRYLLQGILGLYVHTGSIYIDYLICFIYSIILTWVCVWIIDGIRKNKISRKYLLGEK